MTPSLRSIGRYRIASLMGRTRTGEVFRAFDTATQRFVALKTLRKDKALSWKESSEVARFRSEARAVGRLQHPNIIAIHDYGEEKTLYYVVMELVEGTTLASRLRKTGALPLQDTLKIVRQLLSALDYAHANGAIHGGINPRNIVLTADGAVKLHEFWSTRLGEEASDEDRPYLAPEQFDNQPADARTDIFATGSVLYHLLTGRRPFQGQGLALADEIVRITPQPPSRIHPNVPSEFDALVAKALAKVPAERFQSAKDFLAALDAAAAPLRQAHTPREGGKGFERRQYRAGATVFREGQPGDCAFLVESGVVQITKSGQGGTPVVLATLGRGEIFGEMALVDDHPRMAGAVVVEDTTLVVIPRGDFRTRLEKVDKVTHKLIEVLVVRLRAMADEIAALKALVD